MNRSSICCGIAVAIVFLIMHSVLGFIPVRDGAGWDGSVYVQYVEALAKGLPVVGDPYRSIRISGFIPLVVASYFGASTASLIILQAILNALMLSVAVVVLHDAMIKLSVKSGVATLSVATLACSWMFICMPVFYPILSDHIALAAACVSIWCWVRSYRWMIYILCAFCAWLMPGLFLIPLVLAAFPFHFNQVAEKSRAKLRLTLLWFVILAAPLTVLLLFVIHHVPLSAVSAHSASLNGKTASVDMWMLSAFAILISLYVIIWLGLRLIVRPETWKSLSIYGSFFGVLFFSLSALLMKISFDWNTGFAGPPLLDYLLYQSLAAPFKPLVAHFISFGPVIVLAVFACLAWSLGYARPFPTGLIVLFIALLPFLAFGSESRQWIAALPVIVLIYALSDFAWRTRIWCFIFSVLLLVPVFWLKQNLAIAAVKGLGFQTYQWQFYFGRQGPWMSLTTYQLGVILMSVFIAFSLFMHFSKNRHFNEILETESREGQG